MLFAYLILSEKIKPINGFDGFCFTKTLLDPPKGATPVKPCHWFDFLPLFLGFILEYKLLYCLSSELCIL